MITKQKATGRASSIPAGIGWGMLSAFSITAVGAGILALMMAGEKMNPDSLGYGIIFVLLAASCAGALVTAVRIKRLCVQMCFLSGAIYYLSLIAVTALFFGGKYQGMGVTGIVVFIGCIAASIIMQAKQKPSKPKLRKMGYR